MKGKVIGAMVASSIFLHATPLAAQLTNFDSPINVSKVRMDNSSWAQGVEFEDFDKYSKDLNVKKYVNSINGVNLNNHELKAFSYDSSDNTFELSAFGLRINSKDYLKEGNNLMIIKAKGYKDKVINFNKEGNKITISKSNNNFDDYKLLDFSKLDNKIKEVKAVLKNKNTDSYKKYLELEKIINEKRKDFKEKDIDEYLNKLENIKNDYIKNKELSIDNLEDGTYTIGFKAYKEGTKETSMMQNVFDNNVKLEVKNKQMFITLLNTSLAESLIDFSLESNNKFEKAEIKRRGKQNHEGKYSLNEIKIPISNLKTSHKGAVLVSMMGGLDSDIGKYDKYTKFDLEFNSTVKKGWNGFKADNNVNQKEDTLLKELIKRGYDLNKDGKLSVDELQKIKGSLDLSNCKISDISLLSNLSSDITEINLIGNEIEELPANVFDKLVNLENLYLDSNKIKSLPKDIFKNNRKLKNLSLNTNFITNINKYTFKGLKNLNELSLDNNIITNIDEYSFDDLTNLTTLSLEKNNLTKLPESLFTKLKKLNLLVLNNNKLRIIPDLSKLSDLSKLFVKNNKINIITYNDFNKLVSLNELDLSSNEINVIEDDAFKNNIKLHKILLTDNNIKNFNSKLVEHLTLDELNLQLNYLDDNRDLRAIISRIKSQKLMPQKKVIELNVSSEKDKLTTTSKYSVLDLFNWKFKSELATEKEIMNTSEYQGDILKNNTVEKMVNDSGYDWQIIEILEKQDSNGEYQEVKNKKYLNKKEALINTYEGLKPGTYRVKRILNMINVGRKAYYLNVISDPVVIKQSDHTFDDKKVVKADNYQNNKNIKENKKVNSDKSVAINADEKSVVSSGKVDTNKEINIKDNKVKEYIKTGSGILFVNSVLGLLVSLAYMVITKLKKQNS